MLNGYMVLNNDTAQGCLGRRWDGDHWRSQELQEPSEAVPSKPDFREPDGSFYQWVQLGLGLLTAGSRAIFQPVKSLPETAPSASTRPQVASKTGLEMAGGYQPHLATQIRTPDWQASWRKWRNEHLNKTCSVERPSQGGRTQKRDFWSCKYWEPWSKPT